MRDGICLLRLFRLGGHGLPLSRFPSPRFHCLFFPPPLLITARSCVHAPKSPRPAHCPTASFFPPPLQITSRAHAPPGPTHSRHLPDSPRADARAGARCSFIFSLVFFQRHCKTQSGLSSQHKHLHFLYVTVSSWPARFLLQDTHLRHSVHQWRKQLNAGEN